MLPDPSPGVIRGMCLSETCPCQEFRYGLRHAWRSQFQLIYIQKLLMTTVIAYGPFVWIIKLSLFLLLLEAFGSLRWLRHLIYTGILVTGIVHGSICIALAAACIPRHDNSKLAYLTAISAPRCARNYYLNVWPGLFNIFSDCYLLILPLPAVWHLHLPTGKKVGITMMFLTGLAYVSSLVQFISITDFDCRACICSVLALIYRSILQSHPNDSNWYGIPVSCVGYVFKSSLSISYLYL